MLHVSPEWIARGLAQTGNVSRYIDRWIRTYSTISHDEYP